MPLSASQRTLRNLQTALGHLGLVVPHHLLQSHAHGPAGLPVQSRLGPGRVWATLLGVVGGHGPVDDLRVAGRLDPVLGLDLLDDVAHELCELADRELVAVADVDGARLVRVHERDEPVDEVVDVLEGARLLAVAVHGHVLAAERLHDEVGDDAAVVGVH